MKETFELAIKTFGPEHQKKKVIEELGELIIEISRSLNGANNIAAVLEETADVYNMLEQVLVMYDLGEGIGFQRQVKAEKLQRIIENHIKNRGDVL